MLLSLEDVELSFGFVHSFLNVINVAYLLGKAQYLYTQTRPKHHHSHDIVVGDAKAS